MIPNLEALVEEAVRSGDSVSQIERKFRVSNRAVRRIKARLYERGVLTPSTPGRMPKVNHDHND